jgi:hypothetical protein
MSIDDIATALPSPTASPYAADEYYQQLMSLSPDAREYQIDADIHACYKLATARNVPDSLRDEVIQTRRRLRILGEVIVATSREVDEELATAGELVYNGGVDKETYHNVYGRAHSNTIILSRLRSKVLQAGNLFDLDIVIPRVTSPVAADFYRVYPLPATHAEHAYHS